MSNGNSRTVLMKRAIQWEEFLQKIIEKIEENGYEKPIFKPELERLILKHSSIKVIEKDVIDGFKGINKINEEVKSWMKGKEKPISVVK